MKLDNCLDIVKYMKHNSTSPGIFSCLKFGSNITSKDSTSPDIDQGFVQLQCHKNDLQL